MNDSVFYAIVLVGTCSLIYAIISRQALKTQKAMAREAAGRLDRVQKKLQKFEKDSHQQERLLADLRNRGSLMEKRFADAGRKLQVKEQEFEQLSMEIQELRVVEARKRDHLQEQNEALTKQLMEAVKEKELALGEARALSQKAVPQEELLNLRRSQAQNAQNISQLKKENSLWKREVEKARQILSQVKPGEIKRYKSRAARMEQLYTSMKGLREMAEERNSNWEAALRLLAAHINGCAPSPGVGTGAFVGLALEKIGAHLVLDEHTEGDVRDDSLPFESNRDSSEFL